MMNTLPSKAIGIDLGGTKIKAAVIGQEGQIECEHHIPAGAQRGPEPIIADICRMIHELDPKGLLPIGIGVAGQVEKGTGAVLFAPNLQWHNVPLRAVLEKAMHQPVAVLNDVKAHTWGEWLFGAGRGCGDLVCLFIGTGVGGGVVSGGRMVEGFTNAAGELGHIIVDPRGPTCACGNTGCLEAWVSGIHLEAQARQLSQNDAYTTQMLAQAFADGDPMAQALLVRATEALILGVVNIVHAFNPQRILLGGGVITGFPHLVAAVRNGVRQRALKAAGEPLEVMLAKLGNDAAIVGAAAVAAGVQ